LRVGSGFKDAIAGRRSSTGNIGNKEGRIFQGAHTQIGGFFLIFDTYQKVARLSGLECGGINENEAILHVDHFDDSDEAEDLGLGRLCFAWEEEE